MSRLSLKLALLAVGKQFRVPPICPLLNLGRFGLVAEALVEQRKDAGRARLSFRLHVSIALRLPCKEGRLGLLPAPRARARAQNLVERSTESHALRSTSNSSRSTIEGMSTRSLRRTCCDCYFHHTFMLRSRLL